MPKLIRFTDPRTIDEQVINEKLKSGYEVVVQFSEAIYNENILAQLNAMALIHDSNFAIRFYSHHKVEFDCKTLNQIPNVKALWIDCFTSVKNIAVLKDLNFLDKIGIGVFELDDLSILSYDNLKKVSELSITDTKSKALNIEFLKHYSNLTNLLIAGHTKNIDAISSLTGLKTLSLNSITKQSLEFVNDLQSLKTLSIILGGRDNINEIGENKIENLDIIWVRGFNDLSSLKNFKYLKELQVEDEIKLQEIEFPRLDYLHDVKILNCKTLKSIKGLENLKALEGLRISQPMMGFDDFIAGTFPKSLKTLAFYTWKSKQDKIIRKRLDELGYVEFS